jgi:hypothetical protein
MTPRGHSPLLRRSQRCRPLPERARPCRAARTSGGQTQRVGVVHVIGNGLDIIHQRCIGRTGRRCRRQALQTGVAERWQACRLTRSPVLVSTVTISGQRVRARNAEHVDEMNQRICPARSMRSPLWGLPAVNNDHILSESAPDRDESAVVHCRVVLSSQEGWDVLVERGQSVMSTSHCTDWHRVERVRAASSRRTDTLTEREALSAR